MGSRLGKGADPSREGWPPAREAANPLDELKSLLLDRERRELHDLRARLEDPPGPRPEQVAEVLADSLRLGNERDSELPGAIEGPLIAGLRHSIRRDSSTIAGILFPVMGPAIRNAISDSLRKIVESINRSMEHSLSFKGLSWRLESLRSGVPFAEVVLRHTIDYRVEEALLVRPDNGLLIQHVADPSVETHDPDAVSAMLTAICSFVRDAFLAGSTEQGLEEVEMEGHTVLLVNGPHAYLACAVRGIPPRDLRERCREVLEGIHRRHGQDLARFEGDQDAMYYLRDPLSACLVSQERPAPARRGPSPFLLLVLGLALLAGWLGYSDWARRQAEAEHLIQQERLLQARRQAEAELASRQERLIQTVGQIPGIVLTRVERLADRLLIDGLRDPLARDPAPLAGEQGFAAGQVEMRWTPHQDMGHDFAFKRAQARLHPPQGVSLTLDEAGVLHAAGIAPLEWRGKAGLLALTVPGVTAFEDGGLQDSERLELAALKQRLESRHIFFKSGSQLEPDQYQGLDAVAADSLRAMELVGKLSRTLTLVLVGSTDVIGSENRNQALGMGRATVVRDYLKGRGVPAGRMRIETKAPPADVPREDLSLRRVEFQLDLWPPLGDR
ncbi:MAG: OmpA family protein [Gammaproteobacteria bacterium]|nr:OmpA family protein [Gammaproteobacteria bacterium]MBU1655743.1 OmpA family protein [Gammaproteobacteria bacterium]MBU1960704.1 OmpA family protein [Gammaproteobacteria bacterium]